MNIACQTVHTSRIVAAIALAGCALYGHSALRADDAAWSIYVMQTNGSGVQKVVRAEEFRAHGSPRWSHDGKRLAFDASGGPNRARKFFVVNVDGSGLKELGDHATPDWSPDDKQLIYLSFGGTSTAGTWVQNLDGQGRTWLVQGICATGRPTAAELFTWTRPRGSS